MGTDLQFRAGLGTPLPEGVVLGTTTDGNRGDTHSGRAQLRDTPRLAREGIEIDRKIDNTLGRRRRPRSRRLKATPRPIRNRLASDARWRHRSPPSNESLSP